MSFLRSIWTDLVEKRLWPVALVLVVGLVAAGVYASGAGSSSSPTGSVGVPPPAGLGATPAAVGPAPTPATLNIVATTNGAKYQRQGLARDPFAGKPATPKSSSTAKPASSTSTKGGSAAAAGSGSGATPVQTPKTTTPVQTTPTTPTTTTQPKKPAAPKKKTTPAYHVDLRFGVVGQGLKKVKDAPRLLALPDTKTPIVGFLGVRKDGKTATFVLAHAASLTGDGICRPDPSKCELIDLRAGQKELIDAATGPNLTIVHYELDVDSVTLTHTVSKPHDTPLVLVAHARSHESAAGRKVIVKLGWPALNDLHYSPSLGVLVDRDPGPAPGVVPSPPGVSTGPAAAPAH